VHLTTTPGPVVVGIDGSKAAIEAAEWASDEAASRDVALRLVHVIDVEDAPLPPTDDFGFETEYGEAALREASADLESADGVKLDKAVRRGRIDAILTEESVGASMICAGSVGIGWVAGKLLGSTAASLAKHARCPVAIIHSDDHRPDGRGWIAVVVADETGNDRAIGHAMEEARLRGAPLLALRVTRWHPGEVPYDRLDRRLLGWMQRNPDVSVLAVDAGPSAAHYLETHDKAVQLIVVDQSEANQVARLVGPHGASILAHAGCSVLVVHQ
jgi:nucleotide-binding universal stress UspA family protein